MRKGRQVVFGPPKAPFWFPVGLCSRGEDAPDHDAVPCRDASHRDGGSRLATPTFPRWRPRSRR